MGIIVWIVGGLVSFTFTRFIESGRLPWAVELATSIVTSLAAGIAATAMDFGGWAVADGRAFAFAGLTSMFGVGLIRARQRRMDSSRERLRSHQEEE